MFTIRHDDLTGAPTRALLALHLAGMQADSPIDGVFALDLSGLQSPDVIVWTLWDGSVIAGIAALRTITPGHGEIKSMRTQPHHLRSGVGAAIVGHILTAARAAGMTRLSLETGSGDAFEPAHALYRRFGFTPCDAFGDYREGDPFSRFMSRAL